MALAVTVYYVERLEYGRTGVWWISLAGALGALMFAALARLNPQELISDGRVTRLAALNLIGGATIALTLVAVLTLPLSADVTAIENNVSDAGLCRRAAARRAASRERLRARAPGRRAL